MEMSGGAATYLKSSGVDLVYVGGHSPRSTDQYSNMASRLSGQNCKLFQFLLSLDSQNTQKITPNMEVCPESLGAMSEY